MGGENRSENKSAGFSNVCGCLFKVPLKSPRKPELADALDSKTVVSPLTSCCLSVCANPSGQERLFQTLILSTWYQRLHCLCAVTRVFLRLPVRRAS
jgi:hypothetical protein